MGDFPVQVAPSELVVLSTGLLVGTQMRALHGDIGAASAVWPTANRAIFMPFPVSRPTTFYRLACYNGATANGNVDMGIYDHIGNRLVSIGTTAQSGTSILQEFDITDTTLTPGWYYLALASSSGTATFLRWAITQGDGVTGTGSTGLVQMASAFALPATATYARMSSAYIPWMVISGRATL